MPRAGERHTIENIPSKEALFQIIAGGADRKDEQDTQGSEQRPNQNRRLCFAACFL